MTRDVTIKLITPVMVDDVYGIPQPSDPEKAEVMARVGSVTASEFFDGGRNGLRPEFVFKMFLYDYDGQKIVEYNGRQYEIYRTYMAKNDTIELYVHQTGGANNGQ